MKSTITLLSLLLFLAFQLPFSPSDPGLKELAFKVLEEKCNACHQTDLPNKVFTLENMDGFAKKIYKQVFKRKRMPKGNEVVLTEKEKNHLLNWLKQAGVEMEN
ncbi:MAG: hypothetical protein GYB31_09640 [Bacteroidetes bacterium]|nr:hypothetical protein [Bacteroidota bacterium]